MEQIHHLVAPRLAPCPNAHDINKAKDGACNPLNVKPNVDWTGYDCCKFYDRNNVWCNDVVRVNQIDPEKFNYDKSRYQMYARPNHHVCQSSSQGNSQHGNSAHQGGGGYIPAYTDVRALEQTMYVPVVPSNPGGETEVTYPMTSRTMGQPDVTSACCVPVIPSQPGYKNMTSGILPGPCGSLHASHTTNSGVGYGAGVCPCLGGAMGAPGSSRCAPHTIRTPSNTPGGGYHGLPDTFPTRSQYHGMQNPNQCSYASGMAPIQMLHPPNYTQDVGQHMGGCNSGNQFICQHEDDGMPESKMCVNTSVLKYADRVNRKVAEEQNNTGFHQRRREMYGAFGAYLLPNPRPKRFISDPHTTLVQQGNGFEFDYPKNPNRLCYVLERNTRC